MNAKNILGLVAAIVMASVAGIACATPTSTSAIDNSQPNNNQGLTSGVISVTSVNNASGISGAVGNFALGGGGSQAGLDVKRFALSGGGTGAAAAPGGARWNAWGAFSRSNIAYEFAPLSSSGSVNVYLAGVDYTFDNNMIFGVAAAYDRTDVDLNFSGGKLTGNGGTIAPYLGVPLNKNLAFDATIGVGRTNIDTAVAGVAGSTHSDRNMGALGLTYREVVGAWTFSGRGAFLAVRDKLGAYTLSNGTLVPDGTVNLSQLRAVGQIAYTAGSVTPYVTLSYIYDTSHPDQAPVGGVAAANDRDAWTPAIGLRFRADNMFYGSIQYSTERGRSEVKNNQFLVNIGIRF
jgi:hypothetical protein